MAYTTIDDPTIYFNTILYTGDGNNSRAVTGTGFQADWVWLKDRGTKSGSSNNYHHQTFDSVRGASGGALYTSLNNPEDTSYPISSFDSNGVTLRATSHDSQNESGEAFVLWNWLAGGTAPTQTYTVKVVSDSGNKYRFDDFGTSAVTLDLQEGGTYTFDQSDSSNTGHPLRFSTTSDGTHGGGSEFTTNVTTTGTPGSAGAKTVITLGSGVATLYYYCTQHSGMGGQANTNSTFGSSNFSGSIQANVSANTTAGFSIVSYTANGTAGATVGHGLGVAPDVMFIKNRDNTGGGGTESWLVYHKSLGAHYKAASLDSNTTSHDHPDYFNDTEPTSSVFSLGGGDNGNNSGEKNIAYCFTDIKGFAKHGSFIGNGSSDGPFIHTGFKPALIIGKNTSRSDDWFMLDNKRDTFNPVDQRLQPNSSGTESTVTSLGIDFCANGFKLKGATNQYNPSGETMIYMAFAESPFVNSNGVPTNAR